MVPILQECTIFLTNIHKSILPQTPPRIIKNPTKWTLQDKNTSPASTRKNFIISSNSIPTTNISLQMALKTIIKTACTAVLNKIIHKKALPMESSIFTAVACAIDLALNIISKEKTWKIHHILRLTFYPIIIKQKTKKKKLENSLIIQSLCRPDSISNKEILFCWIPTHTGTKRNDRPDATAKSALDLTPDKYNITDLKPKINNFHHKKWQQNKVFQIKSILGEWRPAFGKLRREQVAITRLRIGHSRLTYSFLLRQEQQPQCSTPQMPYTIKHVHLECKAFNTTRKHYFQIRKMKDLFENVHIDDVLSFLKKTGLYQKILNFCYNFENTTNQSTKCK